MKKNIQSKNNTGVILKEIEISEKQINLYTKDVMILKSKIEISSEMELIAK